MGRARDGVMEEEGPRDSSEESETDPRTAPAIISEESSRGPVRRDGSAALAALAWAGRTRRQSWPGS